MIRKNDFQYKMRIPQNYYPLKNLNGNCFILYEDFKFIALIIML